MIADLDCAGKVGCHKVMIIHLTKVVRLPHNASHGSNHLRFLRFSGRCGWPERLPQVPFDACQQFPSRHPFQFFPFGLSVHWRLPVIPSEKEVTEALLSALENVYVECMMLRGQLRRARFAGFRDSADIQSLEMAAQLVRTEFRQRYALVVRSTEEWREFLKNLPTSNSVQ